jgi:hypothetical protein
VEAGATTPVSTSWLVYSGVPRITDPDGAAWTTASVNAIQAGIEVV